ncbi:MAG TPA: UvrD-helicase domain-containing protein [Planctomycetota bacterium]|nr:UvrD-helicase domain-containing protein [Planctomycetota bacterium]
MNAATVLLASAGTGKTWQLTTVFARLLCAGVPPERILAATFTRKAAGEILDRLLERLAEAASSDAGAARLSEEIGLGVEAPQLRQLLAQLARRVERFRVSTLDAYFVHLARLLQLELALPSPWTIADELADERLRSEALARVLARADRDEWALLLSALEGGAPPRAVHTSLLRAIEGAYACFLESEEPAWGALRLPPALAQGELEAATERLRGLEPPCTQKGTPRLSWKKSLEKAHAAARAGDWRAMIQDGIAEKILRCKDRFDTVEIPEEFVEAFHPLLSHAAAVLGGRLREQARVTWRLCAEFAREYEALKRSARAQRFEDLPRLLGRFLEGADGAGLEELRSRSGGGVDHLLLDEFQDTSPAQWKALRPLAKEAAQGPAGSRSFFCVGDRKQSIYGWRQAEPRLLGGLAQELGAACEELSLNRRSSPVVLRAVHRLFRDLPDNEALRGERFSLEVAREAAREIASAWTEPIAHGDRPGAVYLHVAPPSDSGVKPAWGLAVERTVGILGELERSAHPGTIALLVRRKEPIPFLLCELQRRGVRASGEAGNPLVDSAAVNVALSALQLADHPQDSACHFHVATSPLAEVLGLREEDPPERRALWARSTRRRLLERGYAAWLADLAPAVAASYGAWDRGRFDQLVLLALGCVATTRPSDFVRRVELERVEDPAAARVRVMTIHAAKGLQFDAVVLPELDQSLAGRGTRLIARRRTGNPLEPFDRVTPPGWERLGSLIPDLEEVRREALRRTIVEELCLLYVAMTRAVHRLELIVPPERSAEASFSFTPGGLLRAAFGVRAAAPDRRPWAAEGSEDRWPEPKPGGGAGGQDGRPERRPPPRIRLAAAPRERELPRKRPSALARASQVSSAELFAPASEAQLRGLRLHAWLEEVGWLGHFDASDAELEAKALRLGHGGAGLAQDLRRFRELLEGPALRELLSRGETAARLGCDEGELELLRERRFAVLGESPEGRWLASGALDRAVIARPGGAAASAELVDFKSDRIGGGEHALAERAELYRPQLEAYREALARIADLDPASIRCRLAFLDSAAVVDL